MAFDGITTTALVSELDQKLNNGRIEKIFQPEKDEIYINIRNNRENYTLLLSANANNPRVYLTNSFKPNPMSPPNFCMLLRKNISRGKIISIKQPSMERIIEIEIEFLNELRDSTTKILIIEIMGRHSNIILVDKNTHSIIDSIKKIGSNISRYRQVLPGKPYIYPPTQNKADPFCIDKSTVKSLLTNYSKGKRIEKFFMDNFTGISPLISKEICFSSGIHLDSYIDTLSDKDKTSLVETFFNLMDHVKNNEFSPEIIYNETKTKLIDFSPISLNQFSSLPKKIFESISELLEHFYYERDKLERIKQKTSDLLHLLQNKLERNYKKLGILKNEYKQSEDAGIFKLYGELLTANIYNLSKGMDRALLMNYYSEDLKEISIPLNPNLTPIENAQKYFKKYNKSKNAIKQLVKQIHITEVEIYYLESQITNIENSTENSEIEEIRDELRNEGYLSKSNKKTHTKYKRASSPLHFISKDGLDIYVGKNNHQNDKLTLKSSTEKDLWFHTKDIPGSHVVVKGVSLKDIPETSLFEAAMLAAYYSKAKNSSKVPVDYTKIKNVKKPKGAKPGMVIYDKQQTLFVTPKEEEVLSILRVK